MKSRGKQVRELAVLSGLGIEVGAAVGIGAGLGYWLDQRLGTHPWLLLLFTGFGIVAGVKAVLREVRRLQAEQFNQNEDFKK